MKIDSARSCLSIGEVSAPNSSTRKSYDHFKLMTRFSVSGVCRRVPLFFRCLFCAGGVANRLHRERLGGGQVRHDRREVARSEWRGLRCVPTRMAGFGGGFCPQRCSDLDSFWKNLLETPPAQICGYGSAVFFQCKLLRKKTAEKYPQICAGGVSNRFVQNRIRFGQLGENGSVRAQPGIGRRGDSLGNQGPAQVASRQFFK